MTNFDLQPDGFKVNFDSTEDTTLTLNPDPKIDLSIEDKLRETGELILAFRATNQSENDIYMLVDNSPFEALSNDNFIVTLNGKKIDYQGLYARRIQPKRSSFRKLKRGKSAVLKLNINDFYPITETGTLRVEFKMANISYCISDPTTIESDDEIYYSLVTPTLPNPIATTEIDHTIKSTEAVKADSNTTDQHSIVYYTLECKLVMPIIKIQSEDEKEQLLQSHILAYKLIHKCLIQLKCGSQHIQKWFGNNADINHISEKYEKLKHHLENVTTEYSMGYRKCNCTDTSNTPCTIVACTTKLDSKIYLCGHFFEKEFAVGPNQASTIIHELSHFVLDTVDHKQNKKDAEDLAQTRPDDALNNADNYGFFCEEFYTEDLLN